MTFEGERFLAELGIPIDDVAGPELWACCPLPGHNETKPSWSLNCENGLWRCFGCDAGGGPVTLVAEVIGISFGGAYSWLEEHGFLDNARPYSGVEVSFKEQNRRSALEVPFGVCFSPLDEWPSPPRRYLQQKDRRVSAWQVARWGIGYAIGGKLDGRIFVPLRSTDGRLLSYHARDFTGDRGRKRYMYPSTEDGVDTEAMFGEQYWRKHDCVVVTEGAFNALVCETAGAPNVAALGGRHPSPAKLAKLARFQRVVLCTDNDPAGNEAAGQLRAELCRHVRSVARVDLPPGRDACDVGHDELARSLRAALSQ